VLKLKQSLIAFAAVLVTVVLSAPALAQGRSGEAPPTQNVNVVNNPTVQASDLYPAQPFQKKLIPQTTVGPLEACTTIPAGRGLIVELVTAQATSTSAEAYMVIGLSTTAGGENVTHEIPLERQVISSTRTLLGVTQPLRAYADPGTELCIRVVTFDGGPFPSISTTISGQLAPVAPSPAAPTQ